MIKVAVIGCGYWGPNLIRNFRSAQNCEMLICCDKDEQRLNRMRSLYPEVEVTTDYRDLLKADIDGVAIATPVWTHHFLAKTFLTAGKHVFIEKPITRSSEECVDLINAAQLNQKIIMVGHTFEYTAAVNKIKEIIKSGEIGEVIYISSTRVNLGLLQKDINVIWDLAPHDISIISYVLEKDPVRVNAQGLDHYAEGIEEVAMTTLYYEDGTIAFLHNSWIDPNKIRKMVFVGTKKMLLYDDISPNEKIKIYDKGIERPNYYDNFGEFQYSYRYGDIYIPRIKEFEALGEECRHFVDCILQNKTPRSDGYSGLRVVKIMEAANESLQKKGAAVPITLNGSSKKSKRKQWTTKSLQGMSI
jgi:predicted dehydrogenase